MIVRAGEKRVAALDPVHEPLLHQEVERAIDGDRRRPCDMLCQFLDHVVGAERTVRRQQRLKHLAADRRETLAALLTHALRMRDRVRRAAGVIVTRFVKDGRRVLMHSQYLIAVAASRTSFCALRRCHAQYCVRQTVVAQILRCRTQNIALQ